MNNIKNLFKIKDLLSPEQVEKLEAGAHLYRRHTNIEIKVISVSDSELVVRITQGKNLAGKYLTAKELRDRAKDLFAVFFPNLAIHVHAVEYKEPVVSAVDHKWVNEQMKQLGIRAKDIVDDTGIIKTSISAWLSGNKPMSQIAKAFFYYYFLSKRK